ncbi:MAG TPA: histidine phosphatase family protein [Pseudolabrys sp.]|jgi:phosphohistidine phosphatase|nr:histidine phosphatase family protein [Pseudolabrys sp.]
MRRLMLLRHSQAERAEPGESDRARVLTERGRTDAAKIGGYMARHAMTPGVAIVSSAARAQETWKLAAAAFQPPPPMQSVEALYNASPSALLEVVKQAAAESVLIVGHNPGMQDLASLLIATGDIETRERLREGFPTSGLAVIDFIFDSWADLHLHSGRLERFVSPKWTEAATN